MDVEGLVQRLHWRADAYPEDLFPPLDKDDKAFLGDALIQAVAAEMGRAQSPLLKEAASVITSLQAAINEAAACLRNDWPKRALYELEHAQEDASFPESKAALGQHGI